MVRCRYQGGRGEIWNGNKSVERTFLGVNVSALGMHIPLSNQPKAHSN